MTDRHDESDPETDESRDWQGKITQKAILFGPDGRILLTRVDHDDGSHHWEPPGGTYEFDETLVGGLRRELHEELDLDARVGPPVEAMYGGWIDGDTGNPMVTLFYRCETDETAVTLNEEHDDFEWIDPTTAAERLTDGFTERGARAIRRATAMGADDDSSAPAEQAFEALVDPYDGCGTTSESVIQSLADLRNDSPTE